jgi:hypothetical protein
MQTRIGSLDRGEDRGFGVGIRGRGRFVLPLLVGLVALLAAAPAQASFHLIKVREVFPGTVAHPNSDYVELQMYETGQNLVNLGDLEVLDSTGTVTSHFSPATSVSHSANQSTVLIANSEFSTQFPSITPDFTDAGLNLSPAGGAVCWPQNEPPFDDCASWGNFTGQASLPSPGDSSPAAPSGITDGKALLRTIAPGCSTLLENADDTNNSSVDFSSQAPNPRNNAATPTEVLCPSLPNTTISAQPANPTSSTSASFSFTASPAAGASFECKLDTEVGFTACSSPKVYPGLSEATHSFEVRAVNSAGTDPTPAADSWRVDLTPPTATILSQPPDPSAGNSASFTYSSSETGSSFQCSLVRSGEPDAFSGCASTGKAYPDAQHPGPLADGDWTFEVRATDPAGNPSMPEPFPAGSFTWTVDNSLADTTPPDTSIGSRPPDPSGSPSASFTYSSTESGSSFECALDGSGFSGCPPSGITFTGLGNGPHAFQVRAVDSSGNADPTPAGYSFTVALAPPPLPPPIPISTIGPAARPSTKLLAEPAAKTHDRTPTFRFGSDQPGASFQCKLDHGSFKACRSPLTTKPLPYGRHTLEVRAVLGAPDSTPATFAFKVLKSR